MLKNDDKIKILNYLKKGKDSLLIATKLKKKVDEVNKFIEDLKGLVEVKENDISLDTQLLKEVRNRLTQHGFTLPSINAKIKKIFDRLTEDEKKNLNADKLTNICISLIAANDLMINESRGGSPVTILTEAASEKNDARTKSVPKNKNVYKIF